MLRKSQMLIVSLGLVCASGANAADPCVGFSGGGVIAGKGFTLPPKGEGLNTCKPFNGVEASPARAAWIARVTPSSSTTHTTIVCPTRARVVATLRADFVAFSLMQKCRLSRAWHLSRDYYQLRTTRPVRSARGDSFYLRRKGGRDHLPRNLSRHPCTCIRLPIQLLALRRHSNLVLSEAFRIGASPAEWAYSRMQLA